MQPLQDISVQYIKGVGPARKKLFAQLGIESVEDLLYFFPRRYEDRRHLTPVAQVQVGDWQTISGTIASGSARKTWHTKKHVTQVTVDDGSGKIVCVWFNRPYLMPTLKTGKRIVCHGKVGMYNKQLQMVSPEYEIIEGDDASLSLKRIVPVYPLTRGVTQRYLRKTIKACLDKHKEQLIDELPVDLRNKHRIANIRRSITNIHFPDNFEDQEEALKRISFEEFYFYLISIMLRRKSITRKKGVSHRISDEATDRFISGFPFTLTNAQKRVIGEIRTDMERSAPMLRLLQGDVGSGKTLVALYGCLVAHQNGRQSCVMAPTEILARQHYENIVSMTESGPLRDLKVALLTSAVKKPEKDELIARIAGGDIDLVIGTHALINDDVSFKNLSFVVIDEQHKFGVRQRALLTKKGDNPDVLIMTATPIPRTLCITLYGDLDLSVIDELPAGRGKIETVLYDHAQAKEAYDLVRQKVKEGRQAYIIYPIIDESQATDMKAAKAMFKHFQTKEFRDFKVGLVHGQMKADDSQAVMDGFKNKAIDILVATTVVEVGVDVPNATVMVIEHAENFGLAQLHQLRGRIGRGAAESQCLLIADIENSETSQRLKAILSTTDGFKIAQQDLEIRGPGPFFGRHQHGLNELKVANPLTQMDILELARCEARDLTESDPGLRKEQNRPIKAIIRQRYPTYLRDLKAG